MVESELDSSAHVPIKTTESIDRHESNQRTLVKTLCVEDPMLKAAVKTLWSGERDNARRGCNKADTCQLCETIVREERDCMARGHDGATAC